MLLPRLTDTERETSEPEHLGYRLGCSLFAPPARQSARSGPARRSRRVPALATLVGMVDSTVDNRVWLTLAEAARALGVSEKTARRRAKAGQLEARQIPSPR